MAELMGELAEAGASSPPDETGLEDRLKAAAAVLQMVGSKASRCQFWEALWGLRIYMKYMLMV